MASFFSRLSYSFGNEDWITEPKALQIEPHHRVLCITASGDRPLHLLLNECHEMVAVDMNHVQNHLLELKKIAMSHLPYTDYLAFLGLAHCNHRNRFLSQLLPHLPSATAQYWINNPKTIKKGVIYEGACERWARRLSYLIRLMRRKEINTLFNADTIESQREFLKHKWNHTLWKKMFNMGLNPWITSFFLKDPGTYSNFDTSIKPGTYTYERMIECLNNNLARENLLMSLIFKGTVHPDAFPPYLEQQGINTIKKNLHKLSIKTTDVVKFLESEPEGSFDRFSLSDVVSYLDHDSFLRLMKGIYRTAKPGARFCLRQFISRYQIPATMEHCFERDSALEKTLEKEDRAFVYHFTIGTVIKK
jgi:S-adenosylmethionine-diacylglycerol 3-amino-3-carboxypropyl transferase